MAGGAHLSAGAGTRLALLLALVLLAHALGLQWLAGHLGHASALRPLATPMFTRLLAPQAPAAAPPPPAARKAAPRRPGISSIAAADAGDPVAPAASPPLAPASAAQAPTPSAARAEDAVGAPQAPPSVDAPQASAAASAPQAAPTFGEAVAAAAAAASAASAPASAAAGSGAGSRSAAWDSWPADTRLSYRLSGYFRGELHGSARVQWQRQEQRYQNRVEIDINLLGGLVLTSQGEVTAQGLAPRIYEERRRSGPRTVRLGEDTVTFNDGRSAPRPPGVQDTASQFVELSHRFATGQDLLEAGRSVTFWMARPGAVDLWTYDIAEREMLQTPGFGPIEAFRLKPRPIANPRGNITAEMWFAPSLQYLPVRIRVNMGETTYVDLLVEKIEQR